jgi:hypothetical protein
MFAGVALLTRGGAAVLASLPRWVTKILSLKLDLLYIRCLGYGLLLFAFKFTSMIWGRYRGVFVDEKRFGKSGCAHR